MSEETSHASRYVKLTKAQVSADEEIRPGELNQAIPTSQVLHFLSPLTSVFCSLRFHAITLLKLLLDLQNPCLALCLPSNHGLSLLELLEIV